jgi:16S rRNA (guanine(966)-N(2))-methyltransferase RsmD
MRIIAGEFRGRKLRPPPTLTTRPITDRAKQSLFDALGERPEEAIVLDAFAGTGSIGLECLSRGARGVIFVERDRGALLCLRKNVTALGVAARSMILPIDAYRLVRHSALTGDGAEPIDLAFIDPPYSHIRPGPDYGRLRHMLTGLAAKALAPDGLISIRHPANIRIEPLIPPDCHTVRELTYGSMRISWLMCNSIR